jgi:hypothetical protein
MTQALYAHRNDKRKKKEVKSIWWEEKKKSYTHQKLLMNLVTLKEKVEAALGYEGKVRQDREEGLSVHEDVS